MAVNVNVADIPVRAGIGGRSYASFAPPSVVATADPYRALVRLDVLWPDPSIIKAQVTRYLSYPNQIPNANFETDVTGWTAIGATPSFSTVRAHAGSGAMLLTPTGAAVAEADSAAMAVVPYASYRLSFWCYIPTGWSQVGPSVNWLDEFGAPTAVTYANNVMPGEWAFLTQVFVAPANARSAVFRVRMAGTPAAANAMWVDEVSLSRDDRINGGTVVRSAQPLYFEDGLGLFTELSGQRAVFWDTEVPLDVAVLYVTSSPYSGDVGVSNPLTVASAGQGRLRDPLHPAGDVALAIASDHRDASCDTTAGIWFQGVGDRRLSAAGASLVRGYSTRSVPAREVRKDIVGSVRLITRQSSDQTAVETLVAPGSPLLLQLPASYGETDQYLDVDEVGVGRLNDDHRKPYRVVALPYARVDAPSGEAQGVNGCRWSDQGDYPTWAEAMAAGMTWLDFAQGNLKLPGQANPLRGMASATGVTVL